MSIEEKIFIYGFMFIMLGVLYFIGFFIRDYKQKYLRNKRMQRLNWNKVLKIFACVTGFCLLGSINNKMFTWYEAPIMGFTITAVILFAGIFRPENDTNEYKQFDNPEFKVYEKAHQRDRKIKDILK
jgi:hypothetical protein